MKILLADSDPYTAEALDPRVTGSGVTLLTAVDGVTALALARQRRPDVLLLEVSLARLDGFEVCRILRRDPVTCRLPTVFLSSRREECDRVLGLEVGADDYVTKPFSTPELLLRIRKLINRHNVPAVVPMSLCFGDLVIDVEGHSVRVGSAEVRLTPVEFRLLLRLAQRHGFVSSRDQLLDDVWGGRHSLDSRTVDTHIKRLREDLGDAGHYIETVRGFGYRFILRASASAGKGSID